jgi:hypothetical protein
MDNPPGVVPEGAKDPGVEPSPWKAGCRETGLSGLGGDGWKRDNHSSDVDHTRWPSTSPLEVKTCHSCGWKWEDMQLSDRVFLCQNPPCAYHQFPQDRDHNAALCLLAEALRLIGLIDQAATETSSDAGVNAGPASAG